MLKIIPRNQLDSSAWDACVAASPQRIIYGYSWYLDAVLPGPSWKWVGVVLVDHIGQYQAVMPIPLRQKRILGISYAWVVHQPFFCQYLAVFSRNEPIDPTPFFSMMKQQFRYGSTISMRQQPGDSLACDELRPLTTHILDLSVGYETIYQNYTRDRKVNLHRARHASDKATNWRLMESTDLEPLLTLFRENHADTIAGGVADWAYDLFRKLAKELSKRDCCLLRYAVRDGQIEAGALFVREGNRIIYLFNAASAKGRYGNARTLLIDQIIREHAGEPLIFDFESPEKPSICDFYRSFGAVEEPFWTMRWNRLSHVERAFLNLKNRLKQ